MLGWIPIIGPIIDGVVSMFSKFKDSQVAMYTVDGKVDVAAIQTAAQIIEQTKDDIGVRLCRDLIMFPVGMWTAIISWDTIVAYERADWMWHVPNYPPSVQYLPYAVIVFLFGTIGMRMFKR